MSTMRNTIIAIGLMTTSANAEISCPGFTVGTGSHYMSITEINGKVQTFPLVKDGDTSTTATTPHGTVTVYFPSELDPYVIWTDHRGMVVQHQACMRVP